MTEILYERRLDGADSSIKVEARKQEKMVEANREIAVNFRQSIQELRSDQVKSYNGAIVGEK
jgi:hypothetical protein